MEHSTAEHRADDHSRRQPERPNYEQTGRLAAEHMSRNGVVLKYAEPLDAQVPSRRYRFHVFKDDKQIDVIPLHGRSCFLVGREAKTSDILLQHQSISKQHAAIQHRQLSQRRPDMTFESIQRPYLIDLESANGTELNGAPVESGRYYELKIGDVVRFGASTREFVFLAEDSASA